MLKGQINNSQSSAMKDLRLKTEITQYLQHMQLPARLILLLEDQHKASEIQAIVQALHCLDQQWH